MAYPCVWPSHGAWCEPFVDAEAVAASKRGTGGCCILQHGIFRMPGRQVVAIKKMKQKILDGIAGTHLAGMHHLRPVQDV